MSSALLALGPLLLAAAPQGSSASTVPPNTEQLPDNGNTASGSVLRLSLDQARSLALENNLTLRIQALGSDLTRQNLLGSWGAFDWIFTGTGAFSDSKILDRSIFGEDAEEFNPERKLPPSVREHGLSFGLGMHACIGKDLTAGILTADSSDSDSRLNGVVTLAVQSMLDNGCRPDPTDPAEMNPSTSRPYFGRYPVIFEEPDQPAG